jgi:hypothetical protein
LTRIVLLLALIARIISAQPVQVKGTVVNPVSGQPVSGALVVCSSQHFSMKATADEGFVPLAADTPNEVKRAVTDVSGGFSFDAKLPGSIQLTISKQGYRTEDDMDTANVEVKPDHTQGIVVRMMPLSTIEGRLVNQDGDPLQGLTVHAVRIEIQDGKRVLKDDYASKVSDDRGEYRLWYLSAGKYYLKVSGRQGTINSFVSGSGGLLPEAYGPVYFPNNPDSNGARVLDLGGGQTVAADFKLEGHVVHLIRGTLSNMPQRRAIVMRLVGSGDTLGNRAQVNVANGVFGVADVTPGQYVLQAYTQDSGPVLMGETPVTVGDADVTGVKIALNAAVDVNVRVEAPAQTDGPGGVALRRPGVSVQAVPMDPRVLPRNFPSARSMPEPDGSLVLKGLLPGKYEVTVNSFGQNYVASVSQGDTDVLANGFTVGPGGGQDLTVRLMTGGGTVQGKIDSADVETQWMVALFSTAGGRAPIIARAFNAGGLGSVFGTQTIPVGDYNIYVWPASKKLAYREADVFQTLASYANLISVKDGQNVVTVKPIPAEAIP